MSGIDPELVFDLIAAQIPRDLHDNVLIIGSLAAAYHYSGRLGSVAINTKDADVVVQPAGALPECAAIAARLLALGWQRREGCAPQPSAADVAKLSVIDDGWYVLPTFRHLRLVAIGQHRSRQGLRYAAPEMMALSNLLAHPRIGPERVSQAIAGRHVLRSAKDLGRVIALARLAELDEVEGWMPRWQQGLSQLYAPEDAKRLAMRAGDGLRALLDDAGALDDAFFTVDDGLLHGLDVSLDQVRATAEQLLALAIDPLADQARG